MSPNRKTKTIGITILLLFSILSVNFTHSIKAEEDPLDGSVEELMELFESLVDWDDKLAPHPFRYIGAWECNRTMTIEGDMEFNLYFSAPIFTQIELLELINFRDDIDIDVYHADFSGSTVHIGNISTTLEPELLGDSVQDFPTIKVKNINRTINAGDYVVFVIEIIQSDKPIQNFVEKRFDNKFLTRLEKISNMLGDSEDESLKEISTLIDVFLKNLTEFGIGGEEFGKLFNALFSSSLYYGSESYPSSVFFKNNEGENVTVYFHNEYSLYQHDLALTPFNRVTNETKPTTEVEYSWPPILTGFDDLDSVDEITGQEDIILWLALWALYALDEPSEDKDTDIVTYYLDENDKLTTEKPEGAEGYSEKLSKNDSLVFTAPNIERNKILTNITAYLNIHYPKLLSLGKVEIGVELKIGDETIASDSMQVDRTNIIELIQRGPDVPTVFNFGEYDKFEEISHEDQLSLEVYLIKKPLLGFLRPVKLNYGSEQYLSRVELKLKETDNIKLDELEDKEIYAGGSAHYEVKVSSELEDTIKVNVSEVEKQGTWDIEFYPEEFDIDAEGEKTLHIFINSTATDSSVHNIDFMEFSIEVMGKTGYDKNNSLVSVTRDAVEYGLDIIAPEEIEVKHGETESFNITIINKNKGFLADSYIIEVTSENDYNVTYVENVPDEIDIDEEEERVINITIPKYTYDDSDKLEIVVTSGQSTKFTPEYSETIIVNVSVITPNFLESIFELFESAAEGLGLTGAIGGFAGWALLGLLVLLVIIFLIIIILLRKRKFVELVCLERVKEIRPDEEANFEITIKNPHNSAKLYEIKTNIKNDTKGFDTSIDTVQVMLEAGQSKNMKLTVKTNDYVKKEDWAEVNVVVKPSDNKPTEISTITTIKEGRTDVRLSGVFHWPKVFNKGDRVETSFKIWNYGNVSTEKVSIVFYVNGKEKNKVEDIIIPRGGHADIEIPWIAEKGKNEVYIVVN